MRLTRSKGGFSLVELLTVIAIIAILAAIIFPVMTSVTRRAKMTNCITNLHSIAVALPMYQMDNRKFPSSLGGFVQYSNGAIVPFERTKTDADSNNYPGSANIVKASSLYPEYIKSAAGFHCKLSNVMSSDAVVNDNGVYYYAYDSYDVFYRGAVASKQVVNVGDDAKRYLTGWAADSTKVQNLPAYPPPSTTDTADLQDYDYKRQLRFRAPSKDTVVTWCSFHRVSAANEMIPVLFLDGHCDQMPAGKVEGVDGISGGSRWRTHPNL